MQLKQQNSVIFCCRMQMKKKMMMRKSETWGSFSSLMAALKFIWTLYNSYFPCEFRAVIRKYTRILTWWIYPFMSVSFSEFHGHGFQRSSSYRAIQRYLNMKSSDQARHLNASVVHDSKAVVLTMEDQEEVCDEFRGIKLWWSSRHTVSSRQTISLYTSQDERRSFKLSFHKKHREVVTGEYLKYVLEQGKEIELRERRRKLYTNSKLGERGKRMWSHVIFEHPASFTTLAMESKKKQEIIDDLINFTKAKDYYAKIGKAWKRGYLLYGPPGTGKSTMIAAMANFLNYDVYDLELTSVTDNTDLRQLLIDTSSRSIIVIEDIDCSLDLTGQRAKGMEKDKEKEKAKMKEKMEESKVTLSGLLNFIDGLWSSCGGERIIIFTTNHVDKLDPALIRRGRMDKHIELSYCRFEAFKELAKTYLNVESHDLFAKVGNLLEVTNITPADVAENLMPKFAGEDAGFCVERLIIALEQAKAKEEAKAEEEAKAKAKVMAKAEEEEKLKAVTKSADEEEAVAKSTETGSVTVTKEVKENGCTSSNCG